MLSRTQKIKRMHPVNPDNLPEIPGYSEEVIIAELIKFRLQLNQMLNCLIKKFEATTDYHEQSRLVQTIERLDASFKVYLVPKIKKISEERLHDLHQTKKHPLWGYRISDDFIRKQFFEASKQSFRQDLQNLANLMKKLEHHFHQVMKKFQEKAQPSG